MVAQPQFSADVCCGQTAACIRIPLGTEVGLGPGHIVLHGVPAPPIQKRGHSPNFRTISVVAKRWPSRLLLSSCLSYTNASEDFLFCAIQMCTTVLLIRPHRRTTYLDAAYFYRPSSAGCPSVRRSLCRSLMIVSPAKTAESIEMPFGL